MKATPIAGALGAEVHGVDLASLDDEAFAKINELLIDHCVLFFPEQSLGPDDHRAFAARFGEMEIHPFIPKLDEEHPEIVVIHSAAGGIADVWHTDVTFSASPPKFSILRMDELPARGGDTMWSSQYAAYEALSAPMKEMLGGLTAVHTAKVFGQPDTTATHPLVRRHPDTQRPSLFVNRQFTSHIAELSRDESRAMLEYLYTHCEQPQFTCRHRWHVGDICVWDNRCTQHHAINDFDQSRAIQRVTILGDLPEPAFETNRWEAWTPARQSAATLER